MIQHSDHSMMQLFPAVSAVKRFCASSIAVLCFLAVSATAESGGPTFYHDVLPILQNHCQSCHRPGEIAPFPLITYAQARNWGAAMRADVDAHKMPPWFADPCCGRFSNDPSLSSREREALDRWVQVGTPSGNPSDAPPPARWTEGWNIAAARSGRRNARAGEDSCRQATSNTPTRSFPRISRKGSGCRCRSCGLRRAITCIMRWFMFGRRNRAGCAALRWACPSPRQACTILT